ncbi:MAG: uroporphyrinogen decarboxylase family protein [Pseudomonadota bacterium]
MERTPGEQYNKRAKRILDATQLKIPDRVPISIEDEGIFVRHAGFTWADVMYDAGKARTAAKKLFLDLDQDTHAVPFVLCPGQIYDILDYKQMRWPGAKLEVNRLNDPNSVYQFLEPGAGFEAMHPDEYDWFINDPTDYMVRGYWPKVSKTLQPFRDLPAMWHINSYTRLPLLAPFGSPEIVKAFEALMKAGREAMKFNRAMLEYVKEMVLLGYPPRNIAACSNPFDFIGDYMRGTRGRMLDMYRHPGKLKEAVEKVAPMILEQVIAQAKARLNFLNEVMPQGNHLRHVAMYLHGGAGGFMSNAQFKEFYWPTLRKLLIGIIDAGFTPYMFSEGIYDARLEIIKDLPKGKVVWHIETDIFKAKAILGDTCCIEGGPPASLMNGGSIEDVRAYAKKLIDICGKGGGFVMGVAHSLLTARYENVKTLVDFSKEYGVYG